MSLPGVKVLQISVSEKLFSHYKVWEKVHNYRIISEMHFSYLELDTTETYCSCEQVAKCCSDGEVCIKVFYFDILDFILQSYEHDMGCNKDLGFFFDFALFVEIKAIG